MEVTQIYGGKAALTFHPVKHFYTVSVPSRGFKAHQPSVTSVIKMKDKSGPLLKWAARCWQEHLESSLKNLKPPLQAPEVLSSVDQAREAADFVKEQAAEIGT